MSKRVADFLASLDEHEHLALANASGAGIHDARHAGLCLTDQDPQHERVAQLLAYLARAIDHLERARAIVAEHAER